MAKTFRCVALDDPSVVETLQSDISGDLSKYKTISIGDRSFAVNPPNMEHVRRLAARWGINTSALSAALDTLTPEESQYASATEYQQSAASVFGDELLERWAEEDALEEQADDLDERKRAIVRQAWQLSNRSISALAQAGLAAGVNAICRGGVDGIKDIREAERLLSMASGAACAPIY